MYEYKSEKPDLHATLNRFDAENSRMFSAAYLLKQGENEWDILFDAATDLIKSQLELPDRLADVSNAILDMPTQQNVEQWVHFMSENELMLARQFEDLCPEATLFTPTREDALYELGVIFADDDETRDNVFDHVARAYWPGIQSGRFVVERYADILADATSDLMSKDKGYVPEESQAAYQMAWEMMMGAGELATQTPPPYNEAADTADVFTMDLDPLSILAIDSAENPVLGGFMEDSEAANSVLFNDLGDLSQISTVNWPKRHKQEKKIHESIKKVVDMFDGLCNAIYEEYDDKKLASSIMTALMKKNEMDRVVIVDVLSGGKENYVPVPDAAIEYYSDIWMGVGEDGVESEPTGCTPTQVIEYFQSSIERTVDKISRIQ